MDFMFILRLYLVCAFGISCFYIQNGLTYILGNLSDGLSRIRLGSLAIFAVFALLTLFLFLSTWFTGKKFRMVFSRAKLTYRKILIGKWIVPVCMIVLVAGYFIRFIEHVPDSVAQFHFHILILIEFISINVFVVLVFVGVLTFRRSRFQPFRKLFIVSSISAGGVILLALPITVFKLGLTPIYGWGPPGTPLLIWQAFISFAIGFAILMMEEKYRFDVRSLKSNSVIFVLLWAVAALVWSGVPVQSDHFITDKVAPNFEFYPYSDSATYDLNSQELLIGNGFSDDSATKPMYSLFMAVLHWLGGQDYERVVNLQSVLMGIIPSLIYLLVSRLGGGPAGVVAALLIIFREHNSLNLTPIIRVSHTKMIMTESMTIMVIVIMITLLVYWLEDPKNRNSVLIILGGVLGISILLRGQLLLIIPFVILIILLQTYKSWKITWKTTSLVIFGFILVLSPWLTRSYLTRGSVSVKESLPREWMLATRYSLTPEKRLDPPEGVKLEEYNREMRNRVLTFVWEHPDEIAHFVTGLFLRNQIASVLYLPMSFRIGAPTNYVGATPYWQDDWAGNLSFEGGLLLFLNMCLIVLGIGYSWIYARGRALVPIIIASGYMLSVAIARVSGWRFIMPADWYTIIFYAMGFIAIAKILSPGFEATVPNPADGFESMIDKTISTSYTKKQFVYLCMAVVIVGSVFPISERLFQERFSSVSKQDAIRLYQDAYSSSMTEDALTPEALANFVEQEESMVLLGRSFYPRYFPKGMSLGGTSPIFNNPPDKSIIFSLLGQENTLVVIPVSASPDYFPNASDVLVFGCQGVDNSVNAVIVVILEDNPTILEQPYFDDPSCPLNYP